MAELEEVQNGCCRAEAQRECCEPSEKEGCCAPEASICGCPAGGEAGVRERVRERYATAAGIPPR
jgi:hypothetical protein